MESPTMEMPTNLPSLFAAVLAAFLLSACAGGDRRNPENRPAHHTEDGFRNPHLTESKRGLFRFFRMKYFGEEKFADDPAEVDRIPVAKPDLERIHRPADSLRITWIGHATALVQFPGLTVLTDPVFSERASPVSFAGPKRVLPPALSLDQLPPVDIVLISHSHYDHLDTPTVKALGDTVLWIVPLGLKSWFEGKGVSPGRVREFDWWDSAKIEGARVTAAPMQHWSARGFGDRNETLWASWVVESGGYSFWFCGDTGYNPVQFKEIGERFGGFDLAMIPIGAYDPRWFMKDAHVNPEEAVKIHAEVRSNFTLAHHWGNFRLTAEPLDEPPRRLAEAMAAAGELPPFEAFAVGETREIGERIGKAF
jgi:N-acyl-phosphatidylethanolamine-hydrolysing phospholipase D